MVHVVSRCVGRCWAYGRHFHWAFLSRGWERRRWLADNRKEEHRRVLAGLNRINMVLVEQHCTGNINTEKLNQATEESSIALNTSLFIADFLEESQVVGDVLAAVRNLNQGGSFDDYSKEYWKAINSIIASAKKSKL
jgi:hypothetical protein